MATTNGSDLKYDGIQQARPDVSRVSGGFFPSVVQISAYEAVDKDCFRMGVNPRSRPEEPENTLAS